MQLWVHNISHDRDALSVKRPHLQRLLDVQTRIAFIAVEGCFTFASQLPQKAVDTSAFLGFDRRNAAAAKAQVIIVQNSLPVDARVRAAVSHLVQIDIAAVGKIQWSFHPHSSSSSSAPISLNTRMSAAARSPVLLSGSSQGCSVMRRIVFCI